MESEKVVMKYTFYTTLNIEECKEKLHKHLGNPYVARGNLVGKMEVNSFWAVRVNNYYSILINRAFYGYFENGEEGTLIKGKWKYNIFMRTFLAILLFSFIVTPLYEMIILLYKVIGIKNGPFLESSIRNIYDAVFTVIAPLAVVAMIMFFRLISGYQEYDVKQDLKRILEVYKEEKEK